jgi:sugar-phosphatase
MRRLDCSAVILDLDGVLVDSTALVEAQWHRWATTRGLRPEPFLQVCHGRRALETIRLVAPHLDAEAEVAALISESDAGAPPELRPLPGARRLLDQLPPGTWAVATSGGRATADGRLSRAGLAAPPVMICAEDVRQGKPNPEVYQRAAMALGLGPGDCIVIEDSPAGLEAARAAGMTAIALATTHDPAELTADLYAASLADVHLGRIGPEASPRLRLELLIIELARDQVPASFEPRRALRVSAGREPRG